MVTLASTWNMLVADDYHVEASDTGYSLALISIFVLCAAGGVPLSCGEAEIWSHGSGAQTGAWTKDVASPSHANMTNYEEALGRTMYVESAFEYERSFWGSSRHICPRQVATSRDYCCSTTLHSSSMAPRVNTQASSDRIAVGGWMSELYEHGRTDPLMIKVVQP